LACIACKPSYTPDYSRNKSLLVLLLRVPFAIERTIDNSAAYVASWLERLKDDARLVLQAAAQAQRAADFILGRRYGAEESEAGQ